MARQTVLSALFLTVTLVGASAAQGTELATWDQEKVTAIAGDISQAAQELRDALSKEPVPTVGGSTG